MKKSLKKSTFLNSILICFLIATISFLSCNESKETSADIAVNTVTCNEPKKDRPKDHPYGGWYCPDNIGFAPVNVVNLEDVPVILDRLPTQEEARSGASLMYIDPEEYPDAEPIDMQLPRLARFFNVYSDKDEMVVVIQAVKVDQDSVVGFRYLNGGNGSAWLDEVDFLSDEEVDGLSPTPFVVESISIDSPKGKIWTLLTDPDQSKTTWNSLEEGSYYKSFWEESSWIQFINKDEEVVRQGHLTAMFYSSYIQIDYNLDGHHYVEKFLILDNEEDDGCTLHLVAGPFNEDFEERESDWQRWMTAFKNLNKGC